MTPASVSPAQIRPTWPKITANTNFLVPHTLGDPQERWDAIRWWLKGGPYNICSSRAQMLAWGTLG